MAIIRLKDTKPEVYFRKLLFERRYRYSLNSGEIFGHPDIFLRKYGTAIFIHGYFWHRHSGCQYAYMPKSRVEFWKKKFEANLKKDCVVRSELRSVSIKCLIVWERIVNKMRKNEIVRQKYLKKVESFLRNGVLFWNCSYENKNL